MSQRAEIEAAIAALQAQRALIGDAVADAALAPLRAQLQRLGPDEPAAPPSQPDTELRQVSMLFLDVVGSTDLSRRIDPEDVRAVMDGVLARGTAVVTAHEGRVLQYAGDSLLAVFGAGRSREDDAERAVHCGLALLEQGRRLRDEVHQRFGHDGCDVRVGVHTGPVLLGGGIDAGGSIRGAAVNIAARMEQSAPPGGLRISRDTWLAVRGVFEAREQPTLALKGLPPQQTWLVERARPRPHRSAARGIDGVVTPLLGRQAELERLLALAAQARHGGTLHAATLLGEPGIGKSRLLAEFQAALDAQAQPLRLLRAAAHAQRALQPYALLRDLLFWRLQIADGDSADAARAKLEQALLPVLGAAAPVHRLGQLVGLDYASSPHVLGLDAALLRRLGFEALAQWLRAPGAEGGLSVALLEDLHWADAGSLDFLDHLAGAAEPAPLLMLLSARPALLEARPDWAAGWPRHERIELQTLTPQHGQALLRALLAPLRAEAAMRQDLEALLLERGDGNPYFIEELVRMLLDGDVIARTFDDHGVPYWRLTRQRLDGLHLPTTLVGVLQARLDALPGGDRLALQQASVLGHVFWDDALAAIDPAALQALPALRSRTLVEPSADSAFEDTSEEHFRHHLLQQVTYDTVLRAQRRAGHAAAAAWLAARTGSRSAEYLAITAEHFERAGDDAQALTYYERAAADAVRRYANAAALEYLRRALASPALDDRRRRMQLLQQRAQVADVIGERTLQEQTLQECRALADALDDDALRADVLSAQALLASRRGDEDRAHALATQALPLADRSGAVATASLLRAQIGYALIARDEIDAAWGLVRRALEDIRRALAERPAEPELRGMELKLLSMTVVLASASHDYALNQRCAQEALSAARRQGARRTLAYVLRDRADTAAAYGRYDQALPDLEEAAALSRDIGLTQLAGLCAFTIARVHLRLGAPALAQQHNTMAERDLAHTEARDQLMLSVLLRGEIAQALGQAEAAQAAYRQAHDLAVQLGDAEHASQARACLADWHLERGDLERARAEAEDVAAALPPDLQLRRTEQNFYAAHACQRIWAACGDARAQPQLQALHRALLAALASDVADPVLRAEVLERVPHYRRIVAAWQQAADGSGYLTPAASPGS